MSAFLAHKAADNRDQTVLEHLEGTEMGRKYIVPYGLYRCEGYISANLARKTPGFSDEDLELLWQAILNMFENCLLYTSRCV